MSSIKVAVRCRPLFESERAATGLDIQSRRILLDSKTYDPDYTFSPTATQEDVFDSCAPILQCVKDGLNGTIMVYGQTGTGKTFTMLGSEGQDNGVVHLIVAHMLEHVQQKTLEGVQCALTLSMIEIYNEKLTDMLSPNGDEEVTLIGGFPRSTNKVTLCRLNDANDAIAKGLTFRRTAATMMNERSSRSHVVFIVDVEQYNAYTEQADVAHLFLVDLAGSESLKKSQAVGSVANEAGKINKSLLALKSVFLALSNTNEATRPSHVPYRDSKLTELLQDSIGGTARTLMIACISSVGRDIEETKSTLMYAVKAKSIRNAANTEKEKLMTRLRSIEVENQKLRNRLQERVNDRGGYYVAKEEHEQFQQMEVEVGELRESVAQLVKDAQNTNAKTHISESQTKILQGLLEEKESQLNGYKQLYEDALIRFENQAASLQSSVQQAVAGAQRLLTNFSESNYSTMESWSRALSDALNAAPPIVAARRTVENPPVVVRVSSPLRVAPPTSSQSNSPRSKGRRAPPHSTEDASPPCSPERSLEPVADVPIESGGFQSVAQEIEYQCHKMVEDINAVFSTVLAGWESAFVEYHRNLLEAEARRDARIEEECASIIKQTTQGVQALLRANSSLGRDVAHVQELYKGTVDLHAKSFIPVSATPLKNLVHSSCMSVVSSAVHHFPERCPPSSLVDQINTIALSHQLKLNAHGSQNLLPLQSMESPALAQVSSIKNSMPLTGGAHNETVPSSQNGRKEPSSYSAPLNTGSAPRNRNNSLRRGSLSARNSNLPPDAKHKRSRSNQSVSTFEPRKRK
ncbi:Microtubule binding/Kinesin motor domain containing protein, putative [Angomonas deanei]|uniref:Kinesin-like protein n=1 Tax=Angomonas deanei TaxID=59799 RepID=A0A7G2C9K7_9TRYP|nr:Microtubule binding/Kinesin motor domain containing protein, putative [Angomonas deanei]